MSVDAVDASRGARGGDHPGRRRRCVVAAHATVIILVSHEKARVEMLLNSLSEGIEQPARKPDPGCPSIPPRDAIFAAVMKVYSTFSGRRASTDIRGAPQG